MKKNLTRKLALSAVTMGVAALTVTSTTYAWYTNNGSASASSLKATTTAAEGNLLLKYGNTTSGAAGSITAQNTCADTTAPDKGYSTSIELGTIDTPLKPVQWLNKGDKIAQASGTDSDDKKATANGFYELKDTETSSTDTNTHYIWFYVEAPAKTKYNLTLKFTTTKDSLETAGLTFSGNKSQKLTMDSVDSTEKSASQPTSTSVGLDDVLAMRVDSILTKNPDKVIVTSANYKYKEEALGKDKADALVYYNNVMGTKYVVNGSRHNSSCVNGENGWYMSSDDGVTIANCDNSNGDDTAAYYFGISFTFFIDGWDYQCFNAIGGQSITGGKFNFSLDKVTE